ncbi:hypothetical protein HY839_01655 [Candidatus Azambacteria bacterium]|nr:hypothetical protein [Candidatus Azambacteria bacterium]
MNTKEHTKRTRKLGSVSEKILLLLEAGALLGLTRRPDKYFRIVKGAQKEWEKINERNLRDAIKRLYRSQLVDYEENKDGSTSLTLSEQGAKRVLRYHMEHITIIKRSRWDGLWRIVIFDIPERFKTGRDALSDKLKNLGFISLQRSVLVFPYECRDEVDFLVEMFQLRSYVRYMIVQQIDIALELKHKFNL